MSHSPPAPHDPVKQVLAAHRGTLAGVGLFSALLNMLMLISPVFMMQVYDRVLTSRSLPTLVALLVVAVVLLGLMGVLDHLRAVVLGRVGLAVDKALRESVFAASLGHAVQGSGKGDGQQPMRDLDTLRGFLGGPGLAVLFDLPWIPVYLLVCFAFHPQLGALALVGALVLTGLMLLSFAISRRGSRNATEALGCRNGWLEGARRNAETLQALGMAGHIRARWKAAHLEALLAQIKTAEAGAAISAFTKVFRILLQLLLLALGAWLVIGAMATPGVMLAASVLAGRALAPLEQAIAQWRGFVQYREARARLALLDVGRPDTPRTVLPLPCGTLTLEQVCVAPPASSMPTLQGITLTLQAGDAMAVVGPSAAGKSTLTRALIGVWPVVRGEIRLDGAEIGQWSREDRGRFTGYLPQSVDLFDGTIRENIARFSPDSDDDSIIAAAREAGTHEMILRLPQGYDTVIGEMGLALSAGQKQRIGLARALHGAPFLVLLDEPNSNLDAEGEAALGRAIRAVRARGGIVIVTAHRPAALAEVNHALFIRDGRQAAFGPRDAVMRRILAQPDAARESSVTPLRTGQTA
ncbi:MAG: type I secretion system permease/ATPase [Proteobacteria bacterium]|nr:type I secretion system permease/ATPase [Pseudomonadota bacterium]